MKIERITQPKTVKKVRCEAERKTVYWRDRRDKDTGLYQCNRCASVTIAGIPLCGQHAGKVCLEFLLERGGTA